MTLSMTIEFAVKSRNHNENENWKIAMVVIRRLSPWQIQPVYMVHSLYTIRDNGHSWMRCFLLLILCICKAKTQIAPISSLLSGTLNGLNAAAGGGNGLGQLLGNIGNRKLFSDIISIFLKSIIRIFRYN